MGASPVPADGPEIEVRVAPTAAVWPNRAMASKAGGVLRFYFDFISPYAYLGWTQVHGLAKKHEVEVQPVPVLFAAFLNAWGHKGPAEIPPKREYTWKHVVRIADDLGVPIRPPPTHPFNPLLALRVASMPMDPDERREVIDLLFERTWVSGDGVTDAHALSEALTRAGLPGTELVQRARDPEAKTRVKDQTAEAIRLGVFGVPTIHVRDELFWGQDSLPHVDRYLSGHDPVAGDEMARWRDLPASAER